MFQFWHIIVILGVFILGFIAGRYSLKDVLLSKIRGTRE
jgi:hypothetical protein